MPESIAEATVTLRGDGTQLEGDVGRTVGNVARAFAGLAVLKGTFDFIKEGVVGLGELEAVTAQTNQTIKTTGAVANVTSDSVVKFGEKIEGLTGIDQVQIQTGENLLLTFRGIRNEAGKGNDIFDRARELAVDLSVAWGQDMSASAVQLGKALENPVTGMTALQRVGITFSETQKETIKQMVKTGDTLGAQKIILEELEKQVGGSAAAFGETLPAKMAVAQQSFEDMQQSIAAGLLPAIEFGASAVQTFSEIVQGLPGPVQSAVTAVGGFAAAGFLLAPTLNATVSVIEKVGPQALQAGAAVGSASVNFAKGAISAGALGTGIGAVAGGIVGVGALMVGAGLGVAYLAGAFERSGVSADVFGQNLAKMPLGKAVPEFVNLGAAIQKAGESTVMANVHLQGSNLTLGVFKETAEASHPAARALADAIVAYGLAGQNGLPTQKEMNVVLADSRAKFAESAGAASASKVVVDEYARTVDAAKVTIDNIKLATDNWNATLAAHAGPMLASTDATVNYQAAVDKLTEALLADTTGMNVNEQSGRNVIVTLENLAVTTMKDVEAQIAAAEATGNHAAAADIAALASQRMAGDILNSGAAAGYSADQMVMYTADVLNIPPEAVTKILENSPDAQAAIEGFISYFLGQDGKTASTYLNNYTTNYVRTVTSGLFSGGQQYGSYWGAHGAIVTGLPKMASGGILTAPAVIAGEAGPEAVVPLGNTATNRSDRAKVMAAAGLYGEGDGYEHLCALLEQNNALLGRIAAQQNRPGGNPPSRAIMGTRR